MGRPLKIGIIGPESTGKSVLAKQLAMHYNTDFVPEVAREYLSGLNCKYTSADVLAIADLQIQKEREVEKNCTGKFLFCDTTLITIKIWFQVVFNNIPEIFNKKFRDNESYDYYLLTDIDMPWQEDPLREHPNFRSELLSMNLDELKQNGKGFQLISGFGGFRLKNAISVLNKTFPR